MGGGTVGGVLAWLRFRTKDKADVTKTDAETVKLLAEAQKTRAEAETTVADAALKLAQRLSEECDSCKIENDRIQKELNDAKRKLAELEVALAVEQKIQQALQIEIASLKLQLKLNLPT